MTELEYPFTIVNLTLCRRLGFFVVIDQRSAEDIPYVRIYEGEILNWEEITCVRLDAAEYLYSSCRFSKSQKKKFLRIMNSIWPVMELDDGKHVFKKRSGYESSITTLIEVLGVEPELFNYSKDGTLKMPNYNKLEIKEGED